MKGQLTIWLVEDDAAQAQLFKALLNRDFPDVGLILISTGQELLERLKEAFSQPPAVRMRHESHIILSDLHLGGLTGIELLEQLRRDPHLYWLPLIFLTGIHAEAEIQAAYAAGANAYLIKPLELGQMEKLLKNTVDFWSVVHT